MVSVAPDLNWGDSILWTKSGLGLNGGFDKFYSQFEKNRRKKVLVLECTKREDRSANRSLLLAIAVNCITALATLDLV